MTRRLLLTLALALPLRAAAVELPAAGLPSGTRAAAPLLAVQAPGVGTFNVMRTYALTLGDALPNRAAWEALPRDATLAAAPLMGRLPSTFWADAVRLESRTPARAAEMRAQFLAARADAAAAAGAQADAAVAALEAAIKAGAAGSADLSALESQLRALSVYGGRAAARYEEVRRAAAENRQRLVDAALAKARLPASSVDDSAAVPGAEAPRRMPLSKPAANRLGRAATWAGVGTLGVAAAATAHPAILHGSEQLPGILTWAGAAGLSLGRLLGPAKARVAAAAAAATGTDRERAGWLSNRLATYRALWGAARESAAAEARLEARVGDGRLGAFVTWARAGLRTSMPWFALSMLGMLAGSLAAIPLKLATAHPAAAAAGHAAVAASAAASAPVAAAVTRIPLSTLLDTYAAPMLLTELVVLGVVFRGARWAAGRLADEKAASWLAGAAALAAAAGVLAVQGYPLAVAGSTLGIEAVMIALYARTRTLLAPGLARLAFAAMSLESIRMMAFLSDKSGAAPAGLPSWAGLAAAGLLGGFLLLSPLEAQLARVRELGAWWSRPAADGAPKPAAPLLSLGLLWAVPVYLAMSAAPALLQPAGQSAAALARTAMMPLDALLFNLAIVAGLEEWVFRRGLFKGIAKRLEKWGAPPSWTFWPAAVVSALIFSGTHFIDWSGLLAHAGVGAGTGALGQALAGAHAFTWAAFAARAAAGVLLAWLYAASGSLLLPILAHLGAVLLEALGLRWGLPPLLAITAAILAAQWLRAARVPKS